MPDMLRPTQIAIPTLVRVKGALGPIGIYLDRGNATVAVLVSQGLRRRCRIASRKPEGQPSSRSPGSRSRTTISICRPAFRRAPGTVAAVIGVGGGKALDVAKYVAFLGRLPYYAFRPRCRTTASAARSRA